MAEQVLITSLMRALSLFRWATLLGAWLGLILSRTHLIHPWWALALLVITSGFTLTLHVLGRTDPGRLVKTEILLAEVALGVALLVADGFVYSTDRPQSLPWSWPAAGIAAVGIARGGQWALGVSMLIGIASLNTEIVLLERFTGTSQLPLALSKVGLWLLVGGIAGPLSDRLRSAERVISVVRAREEVARQLHDGVLQTLAVVQRRSGSPELAALARDQENSLRAYLSDDRLKLSPDTNDVAPLDSDTGAATATVEGLEPTLRHVAAHAERLHELQVTVVVAADCQEPTSHRLAALRGAVGEALTNAAKHGQAAKVTVYAEPSDTPYELFVSVKDNGAGFDPATAVEGIGIARSIKARIHEVDGEVLIASRPGRGTEVQLWV